MLSKWKQININTRTTKFPFSTGNCKMWWHYNIIQHNMIFTKAIHCLTWNIKPSLNTKKDPSHLKLPGKVSCPKCEYLQKNSPVIPVPHSTLLWELMRLQPIFNFLLKSLRATFEAANPELSCCYQGLIRSESSYCRLPGSLAAHPTDTGLTRRWSGIIPVIFAPDWGQPGCVSI